jgi:ketosteroid isomerase-like protein
MTVEKLNRQRVLHLLDAISRSDLEAALSCCTDDVDFLTHAPIDVLPHMGPCHGKKELGEFWRTVQERYAEIRYEVPQIVAEDDTVAAYLRVFFRKRQPRPHHSGRHGHILHFPQRPGGADPRDHRFLRSGAAGAGT